MGRCKSLRLTEIILFICISAIWSQYPVFLQYSLQGVDAVWWLPDHRHCSPSWLPWRAGIADDYVSWFSRKYSTSQPPQVALVIKNPPANAGDMRHRFDPWVRKTPWKRAWQPTPIFLPGEKSTDRGVWWATVHSVSKSKTKLKQFSMHSSILHFSVLMNNPKLKWKIPFTTRINTWYTLDVNMLKDLLNLYSLNKYNSVHEAEGSVL